MRVAPFATHKADPGEGNDNVNDAMARNNERTAG